MQLTITTYKDSGKLYETFTFASDIEVFETDKILELLYTKVPRLKHYNFTFCAEDILINRINERLILNAV